MCSDRGPNCKSMPPTGTHQWMKVLYGEECANNSTFQHLAAHIPDGKPDQVSLNLNNKQQSRRAHMNCSWQRSHSENWKQNFDEFIITKYSLSRNKSKLNHIHKCKSNWRNILQNITTHQTMRSRWLQLQFHYQDTQFYHIRLLRLLECWSECRDCTASYVQK